MQSACVQYASFCIGDQQYAVDINCVQEIKGWSKTTVLPNQPEHVLGILNLRGVVLPIFDLRRRFDLGMTEPTNGHVVMVVSLHHRTVGLLVDAVSDILSVNSNQIRPLPQITSGSSTEFMVGIIDGANGMVVILALDKLFSIPSVGGAAQIAN